MISTLQHKCEFAESSKCPDTRKLIEGERTGDVDDDLADQHYELCTTAGHARCPTYVELTRTGENE